MLSALTPYMPTIQAPSARSLVTGAAVVATAAVALHVISNIPQAEAGPIAYASCVAGCEALATVATGGPGAAFIMQCIQACLPALYLPTP